MEKEEQELFIRPAASDDYDAVSALCDLRFGDGYLKREEFDEWRKNPELFLVMEDEGRFVGYVCFVPSSPEKMAEYIKFPVEDIIKDSGGRDVIHCRSTVLYPEYEHKGIMRVLWTHILEKVKDMGYRVAYGPAWKYNDFVPMDHLLTSFGFEKIADRENLWYDDETYTCIVCGGRCSCPAVIYRLFL